MSMQTLGEAQTETRIARMAHALKNEMAKDPNGRVIVAAILSILSDNPELGALFEDLCGNFVVKTTMHEHQRWMAHERKVG